MKLLCAVVVCAVLASANGQGPQNDAISNLVSMMAHLFSAATNEDTIAETVPAIFDNMRQTFTAAVQEVTSAGFLPGILAPPPVPPEASIDTMVNRFFVPITQMVQSSAQAAADAVASAAGDERRRRRRRR